MAVTLLISTHCVCMRSSCDWSCDPAGTVSRCEERGLEVPAGILPVGEHDGGAKSPAEIQNVRLTHPEHLLHFAHFTLFLF